MATPLDPESHIMEVETFGSKEKVALVVPVSCTCKQALVLIMDRLGLKQTSLQLFGLFTGSLGRPTKLLQDSNTVPVGSRLSLQRWITQDHCEAKLVKQDDTAVHLLYAEARFSVDTGSIQLTDQERLELDLFSDPLFPTERQFLEVIRKVAGYGSPVVRDCTVVKDIKTNDVCIHDNTVVTITMGVEGTTLRENAANGAFIINWKWTSVKHWKKSSNTIMFEVCLNQGNAVILKWITFQTPQAHFLFQVSSALCAKVKRKQDQLKHSDVYTTESSLPGKFIDPLKEFVINTLFRPPQFNSIH